MITYTFVKKGPIKIGDDTVITEIKAMSLKKAMKSFQGGDAKEVEIEWTSRKGNVSFYTYNLPYKFRKERKGR